MLIEVAEVAESEVEKLLKRDRARRYGEVYEEIRKMDTGTMITVTMATDDDAERMRASVVAGIHRMNRRNGVQWRITSFREGNTVRFYKVRNMTIEKG